MSEITAKRSTEIEQILPSACSAGEQGLFWRCEPTRKELSKVGSTLRQIERGNSWWWGDYLKKIVENHIADWNEEKRRQGQLFDLGEEAINIRSLKYLTEYAASSGISCDTLWVRFKVAKFYPINLRKYDVSFMHYREAMECKSLDAALSWLSDAEENKWDVSDMRSRMRNQARKEMVGADGEPAKDAKAEAVISRFEYWAADLLAKADSLPKERSVRLLEHLSATAQLIDRLRANAGLLVGSSR